MQGENKPSLLRRPEAVGHLTVLAVEPKRRIGFHHPGPVAVVHLNSWLALVRLATSGIGLLVLLMYLPGGLAQVLYAARKPQARDAIDAITPYCWSGARPSIGICGACWAGPPQRCRRGAPRCT